MTMSHDLLNDWVLAHVVLLIEGQSRLSEVIGTPSPDWELSISTGLITLNDHKLQYALLGSVTEEDSSWLWSWADPGLDQNSVAIARAKPLRTFGQEAGLWEFCAPNFPVSGIVDVGMTPGASLALVACPQIMGGAIFSAPYPGGRLYVVITDPQLTQEAPTAVSASRYIQASRAYGEGAHRDMVAVYAAAHDLRVLEDNDTVRLCFEDTSALDILFDESGSILMMHGILPESHRIAAEMRSEKDKPQDGAGDHDEPATDEAHDTQEAQDTQNEPGEPEEPPETEALESSGDIGQD